jgi:hypothetical protein
MARLPVVLVHIKLLACLIAIGYVTRTLAKSSVTWDRDDPLIGLLSSRDTEPNVSKPAASVASENNYIFSDISPINPQRVGISYWVAGSIKWNLDKKLGTYVGLTMEMAGLPCLSVSGV